MLNPRAAVALALVVATTAACTPWQSESEEPKYVALGDSYTAGPGIGRPDGFDTCFRSRDNYPHQLAEDADLDLDDVSCSAGTTWAVRSAQTTPQGKTVAPQIEAVTPDTDVVTVGLGANDFNVIGRVFITCVQLARQGLTGTPCADADARLGTRSLDNVADDIQRNVQVVVGDVRDRAPNAQVVVVGYPEIFPPDTTCDLLPIPPADLPYARKVNDTLNRALEAAAQAEKVEFVDVFAATEGHHICSDDPWIAGASVISGRKATPWHPYEEEQAAVAELLREVID